MSETKNNGAATANANGGNETTNSSKPDVSRTDPLDILNTNNCKVQSLTVSDQHATLLLTHDAKDANSANKGQDDVVGKPIQSLLKLTLIPFHKALLGNNPVVPPKDNTKDQKDDKKDGANNRQTTESNNIKSNKKADDEPKQKRFKYDDCLAPERNSLHNDPSASSEIISFLQHYSFKLKSESGAEYSYYTASPNSNLFGNTSQNTSKQDCKDNNSAAHTNDVTPLQNELQSNQSTKPNQIIPNLIQSTISQFGTFDTELISPATPHQISRAMPTLGSTLIHETPHLYQTIVQPYIQRVIDSGSLGWIQNVIQVKKEKERLLVNHEDFIVNVDTKWRSHPPPLTSPREEWYNHPSTEDLYCLGIVKQDGIATLRDLRHEHIPLLKSMQQQGLQAIQTTYGINPDQIRVFVHYQPQFYHFHIHFTRLENEVGSTVERGHLVSDVIQNLEMDGGYYERRVICYKLKRGVELQNLIEGYLMERGGEE